MKNTRLKKIASVIMTVAAVLTPVVALAAPGPAGRPTLTYGPDFKGADHVQFNSIVNAPNYGDERAFFTGHDVNTTGWVDPINGVQAGHEYKLRIYIHNNANQNLNQSGKGVATGVKVAVDLPTQTAKNLQARATISTTSASATPKSVYDTLDFNSVSAVKLSYVPGSAYIKTNALDNVKLSDSIVSGGATVGSEALDGKWLGCFAHGGWVYLKVKATAPVVPVEKPGITVAKTASATTVAPNAKLDYTITVSNNSKADATNVTVRDTMPAGVTVTGATIAANGEAAKAITNYKDMFTKDGINIGTLKAGQKAIIVVNTTVNADATGKECSVSLLNTAYASATGIPETSSAVTVQVNKDCAETPTTTLPEAGAEGAAAAALGFTAMGTSVQAYLRSKRGLVKAVKNINR